MESIPYRLEQGYILIQSGKERAIVSTGTPGSMSLSEVVSLGSESFPAAKQTLRMSPGELSAAIHVQIDALIGADVLSRIDYRINPFRHEIQFSSGEMHPYGYAAHFNLYRTIPVVQVWIEAKEIPVIFNTGARLTCLIPEITRLYPQVGSTRAFYPGIGWYDTPLHRILIWMSGNDVALEVGNPPGALASMLQAAGAYGILGSDIFQGPGVFLASRRREVIWFWHDY